MKLVYAAVLLLFLAAPRAGAMDILDFARMHLDDQATCVANLVEAAAKSLRAHGHPDQADRTVALFKDSSKNGGVVQMAVNLRKLHSENDRNSTNPNNRVPLYTVEDALAVTLQDNGIPITSSQFAAPDDSKKRVFQWPPLPPPTE